MKKHLRILCAVLLATTMLLTMGGCHSVSRNVSNITAKANGGFGEDDIAGGWASSDNGGALFTNQATFFFSPHEKASGQEAKLLSVKISTEDDADSYVYTISRVSDKSFTIQYYTFNVLQDRLVHTSSAYSLTLSMVDKKTIQVCGDMTNDRIRTLTKIDDGMARQIIGL